MTAASRARMFAELGRFDQAEAELRRALLNRPTDVELLALLAAVLRLSGRPAEALAVADTAVAAGPAGAGAHAERAENLIALSRTEDAVAAASEAVRLRPGEPEAHRVLARAHVAARDFRRARVAARQALAFDPRSVPSLLTLAEVERVAGHRQAAARATRAALAEDPDSPGGRWLIALLDAERLHVADAMRGLRELAADHPARLGGEALAWPVLGVLAGLRRGLGAGVPLVLAVRLAAVRWPFAEPLAQGVALVVAVVMVAFAGRVLLPAGRLPWRCLRFLPRRAVIIGLVAAGASVALLFWYAVSALWPPLVAAAVAALVLLVPPLSQRPR
ncbi:tetratricopeptide (TPR) repeat protein [Actinoplanes octamycinicus]|uniref:Tetratricopeptide (TPR) repeat protein n=1 Tax=Actinoplanes octamycinicus TaxID=135948 RepID=A0A7W7GYV8_9ACTN|nr:tetratricopeptide repeat protein [Actinoplanes octamycinicus]MBB4740841.1 tetratricopeptide (TPR) repeat protein [Actinoplanes octamycinicus]GIE55746.1 hypothetical protein Aoc01nite_11480 [Actinoplanes octamycinicus]